jgi:hypothetical protein
MGAFGARRPCSLTVAFAVQMMMQMMQMMQMNQMQMNMGGGQQMGNMGGGGQMGNMNMQSNLVQAAPAVELTARVEREFPKTQTAQVSCPHNHGMVRSGYIACTCAYYS